MDIKIADWVKAARLHKGLTQEELAFELGFSTKASISAMETGRSQPTFATILDIARLCAYSLPYQNIYPVKVPDDENAVCISIYIGVPSPNNIGDMMIEKSSESILFPILMLKDAQVNVGDAIALKVEGDNLEPVIPDESTAILDSSKTKVIDGKLYGCIYGGLVRIHRIYNLQNNNFRLNSFNSTEHPDITINKEEIRILGKVATWIVVSK